MKNLHSRIKSKRIDRGISQAKLAMEAGVSQPTVANWESGSHVPRKEALMRIGQALNVDESWLLSGQGGRVHQSIEAYLARPIRHVPIYSWPASGQELFANAPEGYLPYPTAIEGAFALVDRTETGVRHKIMIFDPAADASDAKHYGLWTDGITVRIDEKSQILSTAVILGRLMTEIKTY